MTTLEVQTVHGDAVVLDRYGSGPAVVFIAGAGPCRGIDEETTATARAVAARGFTTTVHDRARPRGAR